MWGRRAAVIALGSEPLTSPHADRSRYIHIAPAISVSRTTMNFRFSDFASAMKNDRSYTITNCLIRNVQNAKWGPHAPRPCVRCMLGSLVRCSNLRMTLDSTEPATRDTPIGHPTPGHRPAATSERHTRIPTPGGPQIKSISPFGSSFVQVPVSMSFPGRVILGARKRHFERPDSEKRTGFAVAVLRSGP